MSLTKHGHYDSAITSCISSQVIVISVGLGLPWSIVSGPYFEFIFFVVQLRVIQLLVPGQ